LVPAKSNSYYQAFNVKSLFGEIDGHKKSQVELEESSWIVALLGTKSNRLFGIVEGCNSSSIALIPKVPNATLVMDFRPIGLIGCQYKNVNMILASHLSMVIGSFISPEQSTLLKEGAFSMVLLSSLNSLSGGIFGNWSWVNLDLVLDDATGSKAAFDMLGLHTLTCKALDSDIFICAYIGNDNLRISHLIYADDVIFFGEWSRSNAHNLLCILRCFFLVSGLKINVHKSNILSICVSDEETSGMANVIGCRTSKLPLKYLGVLVGCNMSRCANWDAIINKFSYKLSRWKACMIFVGGRLTLIKPVLSSLPTYFMSLYKVPTSICSKLESMRNNFFIGGNIGVKKMTWVSWNKCLASKKLGGLGIGSIFGLNTGLLFKWIWRFMQNLNDLWASMIKAIHGHNGGIHADSRHLSNQGTWCGIFSMVNSLKSKRIDLLSLCTQKLGNGSFIRFWDDAWPTRGGIEPAQLSSLQNLIKDVVLSDCCDTWSWSSDSSKGFAIASVRMNLDKKGIDVDLILCPICNDNVETVNHLFFSYDMAKDLWSLQAR
nr:RNA-directed DNA polymerase, eukaryota [Tanacetum cinerariifolium]